MVTNPDGGADRQQIHGSLDDFVWKFTKQDGTG